MEIHLQNKIFKIIESKIPQHEKIEKLSEFSEQELSVYKIKERDEETWYSRKEDAYITPLSYAMLSRQKAVYDFLLSKNTSLHELQTTSDAPRDLRAIMDIQGLNNISPYYLKSYMDKYEVYLEKNIRQWDFYIEFDNDNHCDYRQSFFNAVLSKNKSALKSSNFMIFCENNMFREVVKENINFFISYCSFKTEDIYRYDLRKFITWLVQKYPNIICDDLLNYYQKKEFTQIIKRCAQQSKIVNYHLYKNKENVKSLFHYELRNKVVHHYMDINNITHLEQEIMKMYEFVKAKGITDEEMIKICEEVIKNIRDKEILRTLWYVHTFLSKNTILEKTLTQYPEQKEKKKRL